MKTPPIYVFIRYVASIMIVSIFMFPILWWGLTSIKPTSAIFNKDQVVVFGFEPTLDNYRVTLLGANPSELSGGNTGAGDTFGTGGENSFDGRKTILDSIIIAVGSTLLTTVIALAAAYPLSRMAFRGNQLFMNWVLSHRFLPPIAIIIPLVFMFHDLGIRDTHIGLIFVHTVINLPIAVLLLKSFLDDVPKDVDQAAMIDGATSWQSFRLVVLPLIKGGIAATAVLCFVFSWTEFLLSLFLTSSIRTLPVKITTFVTSTGSEWGFISALGTSAMLPSFIFILLVQRHLVRGLTMGAIKD